MHEREAKMTFGAVTGPCSNHTVMRGLCAMLDWSARDEPSTIRGIKEYLDIKGRSWISRAVNYGLVDKRPDPAAPPRGRNQLYTPTDRATSLVRAYIEIAYDALQANPAYHPTHIHPVQAAVTSAAIARGCSELAHEPPDVVLSVMAESLKEHPSSLGMHACLAYGQQFGIPPVRLLPTIHVRGHNTTP